MCMIIQGALNNKAPGGDVLRRRVAVPVDAAFWPPESSVAQGDFLIGDGFSVNGPVEVQTDGGGGVQLFSHLSTLEAARPRLSQG